MIKPQINVEGGYEASKMELRKGRIVIVKKDGSSIRPIVLGRKNYMFSGSHDGAQRSAMLYSFMGTSKLHGINPMIWMVEIL